MSITPRIHDHLHAYAAQAKRDNHQITFVGEWVNRGDDTYSINVLYTPDDGKSIMIEHLVSCTEGRVCRLNMDTIEDEDAEEGDTQAAA